jgi:hypothetical protein
VPDLFSQLAADTAFPGGSPISFVLSQDIEQRGEVGAQPLHDPSFFGGVGHRNFDGTIQPQFTPVNLLEQQVGAFDQVVRGQDLVAVPDAGAFDFFGDDHFLAAVQEWDASHLHEIHPDRVVQGFSGILNVVAGDVVFIHFVFDHGHGGQGSQFIVVLPE